MPLQVHAVTLNGTVFLSTGFADSDIELTIEVIELSASGIGIIGSTTADLTISQNTGSENYSINFPAARSAGNFFAVRYLCRQNTCAPFIGEAYYTIAGSSQFVFDGNTLIPNNQLPNNINFTLDVGNTISGTIFIPRPINRDILVSAAAQFEPGAVNAVFQSFFPNEGFVIPAGSAQTDFLIEGIPPIAGEGLLPFGFCFDCQDGEFSDNAFTQSFNPDAPFSNILPANQNSTGVNLFFEFGSNPPPPPPAPPASRSIPAILPLLLDASS